MTLRYKFGSLALLYVVSLTANVVLCAWCILVYYNALLEDFTTRSAAVYAPSSIESMSVPATQNTDRQDQTGPGGRGELEPLVPGSSPDKPEEGEHVAVRILLLNTVCGLGLSFLGLLLVHRWVTRPVADLREAAAQIGQGNLGHQVKVTSRDELGLLAREVNQMAATVLRMQDQLVDEERRAVGRQTVRCVVHNIRSPLTGIRWLAEAIAMRSGVDAAVVRDQQRIADVVDRVLSWLQGFRESLSTESLKIEPVPIAELIGQIVTSCRLRMHCPEADIQVSIDPDVNEVHIDRSQFGSALEVLIARAVSGSRTGQAPRVSVSRTEPAATQWQLAVECSCRTPPGGLSESSDGSAGSVKMCVGPGDLGMIDRVVRLHGGCLEIETRPGCGNRFVATLPA